MTTVLFWSARRMFTALLFLISAAHSACPPNNDCGPFGDCVADCTTGNNVGICGHRCSCHHGFYGDDCSFVVDICPSSASGIKGPSMCLNGGECAMELFPFDGKWVVTRYLCDCTAAAGDASVYGDPRCDFRSQTSCEAGTSSSMYAFCVNGGRCIATVQPGQPAAGCDCAGLFEGRHCQYANGTAPALELLYYSARKTRGLSWGLIVLMVLLSLGYLGGICFWMFRILRSYYRAVATTSSSSTTTTKAATTASTVAETPSSPEETNQSAEKEYHGDLALPTEGEKLIV